MEASAALIASDDIFTPTPGTPIPRQIPSSDPHPSAPLHTFHAGDRRFESGWGYHFVLVQTTAASLGAAVVFPGVVSVEGRLRGLIKGLAGSRRISPRVWAGD
jgi:hypothetical protein